MTALEAVSAYHPPQRVPIASLAGELGLSDTQVRMFHRYYGLAEVLREPTGTITDLMLNAAAKLTDLRGREHQVKYVVQARTLQAIAPYPEDPLHDVVDALGLRHAQAFAVTQHACASGLLAVELCGRLLAEDGDPDAVALIFVGEKAFTPSARMIPGTALMGEGCAAVLIGSGDRDRMLSYASATHGEFNAGLSLSAEMSMEFQQRYPDALTEVILAAVARAGITAADLALVLPHNVNRVSWVRVARKAGIPVDRLFLDNMPVTGHCFCADSFLNYVSAREKGRLKPGDHYLMAAVGLGSTFSAMVFEH
ncbi:3-oxoacyl-[acyl-carrier-protein] synthase III C-terminal domain-containing protein [Paractinoplanes hotanensis]|uniref:3-oxoacyl-ACP synthase n=1 Tax=Paractinoplanes hotanensis TaxID=2906497 RepID=A0ABT0Y5Y5_9ACTN|nr:3-oxoacyl-[acyl-carrier-protein] synthase III C-terminal domain-containing protein [Actinoplanes hotanensis]MCM4081431.1 3-oxoacyl-ACP synthase [Actinoplanes hotanensis]